MIKYNNSLYCEIPPSIIIPPLTQPEYEEEMIRNRIDEENYNNGFIDLEAIRNRELIKNESKTRVKCF